MSPTKPVYGGNFSHEAVTLKIRSGSPKSNKLLILSDLYRLVNLVTFHPMVHEIQAWSTRTGTCTRTYSSTVFSVLSCTQYFAKIMSTSTRTYLSTEAKSPVLMSIL